jgi:hypothetical protein
MALIRPERATFKWSGCEIERLRVSDEYVNGLARVNLAVVRFGHRAELAGSAGSLFVSLGPAA